MSTKDFNGYLPSHTSSRLFSDFYYFDLVVHCITVQLLSYIQLYCEHDTPKIFFLFAAHLKPHNKQNSHNMKSSKGTNKQKMSWVYHHMVYSDVQYFVLIFFIHWSYKGSTKYKGEERGFEPMTYYSQHLNLNNWPIQYNNTLYYSLRPII